MYESVYYKLHEGLLLRVGMELDENMRVWVWAEDCVGGDVIYVV